jgi:sugar/nucleoside kinase (ribokinase family)
MPADPPRVLVCGDVVNDVLVETPAPVACGDDNPATIEARPGGSAANQAAWMAWCGLGVTFAGRAGAGDVGFHRAELARFGVRPRLAADQSAATGAIVVLVGADGERTMITDRGANLRLRAADVPAALLEGVALLHLTGYTFFHPEPRRVALKLIAEATRRGVPFTVDPGSAAFLAELEPGAFLRWTGGAAVCFPNREEAAALAGESEPAALADGYEPAAMAVALTRHYGAVALKLGADGAVLAAGGGPAVRIPARPAMVRDTTGAGDAFCAGFLAAWLTGSDLGAAAGAGARTAAQAVSALGGRPALPEPG